MLLYTQLKPNAIQDHSGQGKEHTKFSKRLRSRISTATNSAIAAANKTYEGYKVKTTARCEQLLKIDQLEKNWRLKSLMQMMAKNNLDKITKM